jgi:hypothetical protein
MKSRLCIALLAISVQTSAGDCQQLPAKNASEKPAPRKMATVPSSKKSKTDLPVKKTAGRPRGLIPPPPPVTPLGGKFLYMGGPALLSPEDVKRQRDKVSRLLTEAKQTVTDTDKKFGEKKQRSVLFQELYKEGVVSKRELESAQDSVSQSARDLESDKQKVIDLQQELDSLNSVLKKP